MKPVLSLSSLPDSFSYSEDIPPPGLSSCLILIITDVRPRPPFFKITTHGYGYGYLWPTMPTLWVLFHILLLHYGIAGLDNRERPRTLFNRIRGWWRGNWKSTLPFLHMMVRSSLAGSNRNLFTFVFNPLFAQWGQYLCIEMSSQFLLLMAVKLKLMWWAGRWFCYLGGFNRSRCWSPLLQSILMPSGSMNLYETLHYSFAFCIVNVSVGWKALALVVILRCDFKPIWDKHSMQPLSLRNKLCSLKKLWSAVSVHGNWPMARFLRVETDSGCVLRKLLSNTK